MKDVVLYHNPTLGSIERYGVLLDEKGMEIPYRVEVDRHATGTLEIPYLPQLAEVNDWQILEGAA